MSRFHLPFLTCLSGLLLLVSPIESGIAGEHEDVNGPVAQKPLRSEAENTLAVAEVQQGLGDARLDSRVLSNRSDGIRNGPEGASNATSTEVPMILRYPGDPYSSSELVSAEMMHPSSTAPAPGSLSKTTLPYYSFDTREWVEYFPTEGEPFPPSNLSTVAERFSTDSFPSDPFSSNRISPVFESSVPPSTDSSQGRILLENLRLAAADPIVGNTVGRVDLPGKTTPKPKIDLSPSYSKQLKYVAVCGVVVVQANFPLSEIQSILTEIEGLQRDLNLYMGVPAPEEKIELCLFRDEASYHRFLRARFPKAPRDRRALYIKLNDEPGTLLVQRSKDFALDLRHEMTHAIVHASIPAVPIWLDEGLAKYFEPPSTERSESNPYMKSVRWNTRFGAVPSLHRLEKLEHIGEMGSREYRDSWAWVHFMVHHSPDTHRLLAGYLQLLSTLPKESETKSTKIAVPPLSLYLDEVLDKSREKYREHFRTWGVEEKPRS